MLKEIIIVSLNACYHRVRNSSILYINDLFLFFAFAEIQGDSLTVDFPEQKNWTGIVSEMEIVASAVSGNFYCILRHDHLNNSL